MEIKISTQQILKVIHVISWVLFIGLCVETGGILFNGLYAFFWNPEAAANFWEGANLSPLFIHDSGYFLVITFIMTIAAVFKTLIFYLVIVLFSKKGLSFSSPFSNELYRFLSSISYLTLGIGLFSYCGDNYSEWLTTQNVTMPSLEQMRLAGADVWLFMSVTLFIITQIFKRGMELQSENDLTI